MVAKMVADRPVCHSTTAVRQVLEKVSRRIIKAFHLRQLGPEPPGSGFLGTAVQQVMSPVIAYATGNRMQAICKRFCAFLPQYLRTKRQSTDQPC